MARVIARFGSSLLEGRTGVGPETGEEGAELQNVTDTLDISMIKWTCQSAKLNIEISLIWYRCQHRFSKSILSVSFVQFEYQNYCNFCVFLQVKLGFALRKKIDILQPREGGRAGSCWRQAATVQSARATQIFPDQILWHLIRSDQIRWHLMRC